MQDAPFDLLPEAARRDTPLSAGDVVFRQGDAPFGVFRVLSGRVALRRVTGDGETLVLHTAQAGTMFAEASLFADAYHCEAVATRPGVVACYGKSAVLEALARPDFTRAFAALLSRQVQETRHIVELRAIRSARDRVLAGLRLGLLSGSVTEFAGLIGLSREACYRALAALTSEGLAIRTARGRYRLARGAAAQATSTQVFMPPI